MHNYYCIYPCIMYTFFSLVAHSTWNLLFSYIMMSFTSHLYFSEMTLKCPFGHTDVKFLHSNFISNFATNQTMKFCV